MRRTTIKKTLLTLGLYRPARILQRHLDQSRWGAYTADKRLYSQLIPETPVLCFDVGANIGRISESLLALGHHVVAFEPQKECVREVIARCSPYKEHLQIRQIALGESPSVETLFVRELSGQTSLNSEWEGRVTDTVQVPVSTLDIEIKQFGLPYYCKIDVEGWESYVLRGLSRPIPLMSFEYHQNDGKMSDAFTCLDRLRSLARIEVNITPREQSTLVLDDWVDGDEFKSVFRSSFENKNQFLYGDLYVRML
jgi:FkbM family methyltransferase